jgi:hypothetical protein
MAGILIFNTILISEEKGIILTLATTISRNSQLEKWLCTSGFIRL